MTDGASCIKKDSVCFTGILPALQTLWNLPSADGYGNRFAFLLPMGQKLR